MIDCPGTQDGSSLRSLIDKPPVCGNSFSPLTGALLTGFRLHTGPVLSEYNTHKFQSYTYCHHVGIINYTVASTVVVGFSASRTVQTDAHTASKEEEQTQAQTPSTTGPITTG